MENTLYVNKHLGYRSCLVLGLVQSLLSDLASDVNKIIHTKKLCLLVQMVIWREFFSGSSNEKQTNDRQNFDNL